MYILTLHIYFYNHSLKTSLETINTKYYTTPTPRKCRMPTKITIIKHFFFREYNLS